MAAGGFPVRPNRSSFGPKPENRFPVRDPKKEFDGPTLGDLLLWTVSGSAVAVARAWAIVRIATGPNVALVAAGEAWDPDGASAPTPAYSSAGTYTLQYAATYPDKDGAPQPVDIKGAFLVGLGTLSDFRGVAKLNSDGRTVDVRVRNSAGTLADMAVDDTFAIGVW